MATLVDLAESGRPVPCMAASVDVAACWTSDDEEQQTYAARLCVGCAGLKRCAEYGAAWPKEVGTYGAMTERERRDQHRRNAGAGGRGSPPPYAGSPTGQQRTSSLNSVTPPRRPSLVIPFRDTPWSSDE